MLAFEHKHFSQLRKQNIQLQGASFLVCRQPPSARAPVEGTRKLSEETFIRRVSTNENVAPMT